MLPPAEAVLATGHDFADLDRQLQSVVAATNDATRLQRNWWQITIVDRILSLAETRTWARANVQWAEMRRSVFWVKAAEHWCSANSPQRNPLKLGIGLLVLELFYRYVWAEYTLSIYNQLKSLSSQPSSPAPSAADAMQDAAVVSDVVNGADLGAEESSGAESAESESEEGEESSGESEHEAQSEAEMEDGEVITTVPSVTSLFCLHEAVFSAVNSIERAYFEPVAPAASTWGISAAVTSYLQTSLKRARAADPLAPQAITLTELHDKVSKYYKKHLVPLLRCLGMQLFGPDLYVWSWLPHMRSYVDRTYTTEFRNLSENGEVSASAALLELFPDMLLRAESRANLYLSRATTELHSALTLRGGFDSAADQAATALSQLLSQRAALLREGASGAHMEALEKAVEEARVRYEAATAQIELRPSVVPAAAAPSRALKARPELHVSLFPATTIPASHSLRVLSLLPSAPAPTFALVSAIDSALPLVLSAVGAHLHHCCVSAHGKATAKARAKAITKALTEATVTEIGAAILSKDTAQAFLARAGRHLSAVQAADWLVQAEKTTLLPQKQRAAALSRLAKILVDGMEGTSFQPSSSRKVSEALATCATFARTSPLVICVSATDLFAWRFSKKSSHYSDLCTLAGEHPAHCRLLVMGSLYPEEWGGNVHTHLPEWILAARTRLPRGKAQPTIALPAPAPARVALTTQAIAGQDSAAPTTATEEPGLDDAYVFVPTQRLPRFAQHFALHSVHVTAAELPAAFFAHLRQDVVAGARSGVSLVALWEPRDTPPADAQRQSWVAFLRALLAEASSAASLSAQLITAVTQELQSLVASHDGVFVVSDHPGRVTILSNGTAYELVRFYTDNVDHALDGAAADGPPRQAGDDGAWHTWRMPISAAESDGALQRRQLSGSDGDDRLFKYAIVGSKRFWRACDGVLLRRLRVRVEVRLFDTPDDLVACAVSGPASLPMMLPALRRDASNGEPQTRLVSSVEEWLLGSRESLRDEIMASSPEKGGGDLVTAALMNISLSDPANWAHWRRELQLDTARAPGWARVTDRDALPAAALQELNAAIQAL